MTAQPIASPFQQPAVLPRPSGIPAFEKAPVASTMTKLIGTTPVEGDTDLVLSIDDRVRLIGEFRVVGVSFKVDPKTGDVVREQLVKVINLTTCPWDPADPTDDGIVRARP